MNTRKPLTKSQIQTYLAERVGITREQVGDVIDELTSLIVSEVNEVGSLTIPGVCKFVKKVKPARPEKQMKSPLTGQMITVKAKEASNTIKIQPLKGLKDSIHTSG